jgi:hypothetical protein
MMIKLIAATILAAAIAAPLQAENWVASWSASPHAAWRQDEFALPTGVPASLSQQTVRETARISIGGQRVRVVLSNRYGKQPVTIGAAHLARAAATPDGRIAPGSDRPLTFGGQRSATIPAGAPLVSDAVDMPVEALEKLAVSIYLPQATPLATFHWGAQQTGQVAAGDAAGATTLPAHSRCMAAPCWPASWSMQRRPRALWLHSATPSPMAMAPRRTGTAGGRTIWPGGSAAAPPSSMPASPAHACWATAWASTPLPASSRTCSISRACTRRSYSSG